MPTEHVRDQRQRRDTLTVAPQPRAQETHDEADAPALERLGSAPRLNVATVGVRRSWNPFKKKEKTPEEQAQIQAAKDRKEKLVAHRAEMKAKDKAARAKAKEVNARNKQVSTSIKGQYDGQTDPLFKPQALKDLENRLREHLDLERYVRSKARYEVIGGQAETEELLAQAELAEEEAVEKLWAGAPEDVRAFRPLRYDEFDKALNEVREARNESMAEEQSDISKTLGENEAKFGAPMTPKQAAKKAGERRELERRQQRHAVSHKVTGEQQAGEDQRKLQEKGIAKLTEVAQERPIREGEKQRVMSETARKGVEEKYGHDEGVVDAQKGMKTASTATKYIGKADKQVNKQLPKVGAYAKDSDAYDAHALASQSAGGLAEIFSLVSTILSLVDQISDIRKGVADPQAKLQATRTAVAAFTSASKTTSTTLKLAKEGVEKFGGAGHVIGEASSALPIVGIITSSLGMLDKALELVPTGLRLTEGYVGVDEAVLGKKAPLAASLDRINSRNAQLVEKSSFDLAKNVTMLGLHITEVATAGGFAIPAAAKLTVSIVGMAHSIGHKIYDTVGESKSSTALKDFRVKHKEGASRDVLRYDIGSSIDVIIVAARKHKLRYARTILVGYGIHEHELDSMRHEEIREKALEGLHAEGDPKTVSEKIDAAKKSVKETLGLDDKPGPKGEEKGTLEKVMAVPAKISGAITGIPGKIAKKVTELKEKHEEAKRLVEQKNKMAYGGRTDRGSGSALKHFLRGEDKNEKSYAKVRVELAGNGVAPEALPRSKADRESREKVAEERAGSSKKEAVHQFDPAFAAKADKASMAELYAMLQALDHKNPYYEGNLEYAYMRAQQVGGR